MNFRSFPAKVLLFGEYLVIDGGQALALPVSNFSGRLSLGDEPSLDNIAPFIQYLGALPNIYLDQDLIESLDLGKLVFDSDIPTGYGAGSSGALTAAVFDAFVEKHEGSLREALASMEDFFHGSSSGLDPYICYTGEPSASIDNRSLDHFYLLDTGVPRKTGPLVELFRRMELHLDNLHIANNQAIKAITDYDYFSLKSAMEKISAFQFQHFQPMIPDGFKKLWKEVMADSQLSIKLCGAGGGGFLLLMADEEDHVGKWAEERKLSILKIKSDQ